MASIQCKMCGGMNELREGASSWECPYCGTLTTFPKLNTEQREHLYTRAEHFRQNNNFDKAVAAYEAILNIDAEDPEAYWGMLISRYGIEYVEDPVTHERIPTCHRVQFDSILADPDYLNALKYASPEDRDIYEKEGRRISEIQKGILRISAQEKPYDVFICYKETTDAGTRTKDSTLAQDIYYQLTNQGLKVFFSRITLEHKLGQQYEPYIFAALNSSKVMLVIGSKKEYFEAVWVKNEWSRYLALMKKDRSRLLIPCFKDMDAYDIPEELSMFQCQDMGKIGFIQDILHGIMKVVKPGGNDAKAAPAASASGAPANSAKIIRRISILMEQQEWDKATSYCEKLLESDPENADVYLLLSMATRHIPNEAALLDCRQNLMLDKNFQMAIKFSGPERREQLLRIQQEASFSFSLAKCLERKGVSDKEDLCRCPQPLIEDEAFQQVLKVASPEKRDELRRIQDMQPEYFFSRCMSDLAEANPESIWQSESPLVENSNFQIALRCASPAKKQELLNMVKRQQEFFRNECLTKHSVSHESELKNSTIPLLHDLSFQRYLHMLEPERRESVSRLQAEQANFFLGKALTRHHVSNIDGLVNSSGSLEKDTDFRIAFDSCPDEKQKENMRFVIQEQRKRLKDKSSCLAILVIHLIILLLILFAALAH